jgi:GDP-L-fucose synthase
MPTNMYGPGDNYHPENSHVLPALIRKMHLARLLEQGRFDELAHVHKRELLNGGCQLPGDVDSTQQPSDQELTDWLSKSGVTQTTINDQRSTKLACWGSGSPLREFLYSDDLAEACVFLLENGDYKDMAFEDESGTVQAHVNVGSGKEVTIKELAETVKEVVGYEGEIEWDASKPDGTPRKLMDSTKLNKLGWKAEINLAEGITRAYEDFKSRFGI